MKADTTARTSATWSTCWTFSSEKSLASILESVNGEMVTGAAVRLISVVVDDCPKIDKTEADAVKTAARPTMAGRYRIRRRDHAPRAAPRHRSLAPAGLLPCVEAAGGAVAAYRAREAFGVLWVTGLLMKACGLAPAGADVAGMIRWASAAYTGSAELLDPAAKSMRAVETYLRTHVGTTVMRRGVSDKPSGEVWAWFDKGTVYLRVDVVERLPGVTLGRLEVAKAFRAAGVLLPQGWAQGSCGARSPATGLSITIGWRWICSPRSRIAQTTARSAIRSLTASTQSKQIHQRRNTALSRRFGTTRTTRDNKVFGLLSQRNPLGGGSM